MTVVHGAPAAVQGENDRQISDRQILLDLLEKLMWARSRTDINLAAAEAYERMKEG